MDHLCKVLNWIKAKRCSPIRCGLYQSKPIRWKYYRIEIEKILAMNLWELAQPKWATPIVFVAKRWHFTVMFKTLHIEQCDIPRIIFHKKDGRVYQFTRITTLILMLTPTKDSKRSQRAEWNQDYAVFMPHHCVFRSVRMLSRTWYGLGRFRQDMNVILSPLKSQLR